jgi:hypothetical protein
MGDCTESEFRYDLMKPCQRLFSNVPRKVLECRSGSSKERLPMFRVIFDAAYALRHNKETAFVLKGMPGFTAANLNEELALAPLRGLMHLGVSEARTVLNEQANTLRAKGHNMAGVYRAASLEPVKSDLKTAI